MKAGVHSPRVVADTGEFGRQPEVDMLAGYKQQIVRKHHSQGPTQGFRLSVCVFDKSSGIVLLHSYC